MDEGLHKHLVAEYGGEFIQKSLANSDPRRAIKEFQEQNGLMDPVSASAMSLLDVLGVSRAETYKGLMQTLREKLLASIPTLGQTQLDSLLSETFPYIAIPELQCIPLALLERHPKVPEPFLQKLADARDTSLYKDLPLSVKIQIWEVVQDLFQSEVFLLFTQYINEATAVTTGYQMVLTGSAQNPKRRRETNPILQQLAKYVGSSVVLYHQTLHFIRTLFVNTANAAFCTLRSELLMALHDLGVAEIRDADPSHRFTWCLDACIRDECVEERRLKEMQSYFESLPANDATYGDIAMVLHDPNACNMLLRNILSVLTELMETNRSPKKHGKLKYLSQLVTLGYKAHDIARTQTEFALPKLDKSIMNEFYPLFIQLLAADRSEIESEVSLGESMLPFIMAFELSRKVLFLYTVSRIRERDVSSLRRLLQTLSKLEPSALEDLSFLVSFVTEVALLGERFDPTLRHVLLDEFLLELVPTSVLLHENMIKIVADHSDRISTRELLQYLAKTWPIAKAIQEEPGPDADRLRIVYSHLFDKNAFIRQHLEGLEVDTTTASMDVS
eukprot:GILJ01007097.1.p1 GENE.GILJ01007097.1~~GILJ01007097.1.p1  ORF type:complete len:559 (+),score=89.17 GILJ01007097.1:45-1721(+)